jgi:hypothetical protein
MEVLMKGYHSDRVGQSFDTMSSRRKLLRAALIGSPALVLASVSAGFGPNSTPAAEAVPVSAEVAFDTGDREHVGDADPGGA